MATTGFWPVKGSLKDVIDYADNPDKTTDPKFLDGDLAAVLRYAENDDKTDQKMYVTGIRCTKDRAYEDMLAVQKRFGLRGKNVAYHGYQSFLTGEVTPEEAHRIGIETAKRMWGDEFQVLVTTHLNTKTVHNHMVVNAVSYRDGHKFQNHIRDHIQLREISDAICRERSLSVLEGSNFYGGEKGAYWVRHNGGLTHRDILKRDIEDCLRYALDYDGLIAQLRAKGYAYDWQRGSVKAPDWDRAIRLDRLGYTPESIEQRITHNLYDMDTLREVNEHCPYKPQRFPLLELEQQLEFTVEHSHDAGVILIDLVFLMFLELLQLTRAEQSGKTKARPLSPSVRMELARFDKIHAEYLLLSETGIHTPEELTAFIEGKGTEVKALERERQGYRNQLRRPKSPEVDGEIKKKISEATAQLAPLRKDLHAAKRISERWRQLYDLLQTERGMEIAALTKERTRTK